MRTVSTQSIADAVARLCLQANHILPGDIQRAIQCACESEPWPQARRTLSQLLDNIAAADTGLPLCQDTGMAFVFIRLGQAVALEGPLLQEAVDDGVRRAYAGLRKSVVSDPLARNNTGDNTPAILHVELVGGEGVHITVAPKGFGSENMSRIAMLNPSDGRSGVMDFVVDTVREAGPNPCPPVVVGVGLGGSFEHAALLSKRALLRPLDMPNADAAYALLERELLERINALGVGPQGLGGRTTALGVSIETHPTHIAALPCAVNISCHATRRASVTL